MKNVPVSGSPNRWDWMTLPPDSPITPVTACTIPGGPVGRVTNKLRVFSHGSQSSRFIPQRGRGTLAGDATGPGGGVGLLPGCCGAGLRCCVVAVGVAASGVALLGRLLGWAAALLRSAAVRAGGATGFHARFTSRQG